MSDKVGFVRNAIMAGCCVLAGYLAANSGTPAVPTVDATPVSVGAPPDLTLGMVKCLCSGDCDCKPVCVCKEPDECNPPKADEVFTLPCTQCGGDGLLSTDYGEVLCPTCGRGKSDQLPKFQPTLYTQPQPAPKPRPVAAVQTYSSCANGSCGSGSRGSFRIFRRRR